MDTTIIINKIKSKDNKITITYERTRQDRDDTDKYVIESYDQAKPEFHKWMKLLRETVVEICELPSYFADKITITGVSYSWAMLIMGATITAQIKLEHSDAPLCITTPHKPTESYGGNPEDPNLLTATAETTLEGLIKAATAYINGDRLIPQTDLFRDGEVNKATGEEVSVT